MLLYYYIQVIHVLCEGYCSARAVQAKPVCSVSAELWQPIERSPRAGMFNCSEICIKPAKSVTKLTSVWIDVKEVLRIVDNAVLADGVGVVSGDESGDVAARWLALACLDGDEGVLGRPGLAEPRWLCVHFQDVDDQRRCRVKQSCSYMYMYMLKL